MATSVEMLSGRRKRDYEADSLAAQAEGDAATESTGISPNEAAEVGVMTMADAASDESIEESSTDDEQVLVLA